MSTKVIIIGAGASGYAAACRLLEKGVTNIKILEAQDRIGGRVHTVDFGTGKIDLGAQWCHGEKDNIVYNMVKDLDLLQSSRCDYTIQTFIDSKGKFLNEDVSSKLNAIAVKLYVNEDDIANFEGSYEDYFSQKYNAEVEKQMIDKTSAAQVLEWYHKFFNSINASSNWQEVSAKGLLDYKTCDGDITLNWKGKGYGTIFSVLKKKIPDATEELPVDDKIEFNKEVTKINWDNPDHDGVKIDCKDGSHYDAEHVIVTPSLGFLKENHKTLFHPELPSKKVAAIEGLAIGPVNKIFLKFKTKWWPEKCIGFSLIWPEEGDSIDFIDGPKKDGRSWVESVFGFYPIEENPEVLLAWVTGPLSAQIEQLTNETMTKGLIYLLNKFLGSHYKISDLESIKRSSWYTNPFFRGSYSFRSMETVQKNTSAADLADPLSSNGKQVVLFAGEATHSSFYSTVHGAIETGFREAERIVEMKKFGSIPRSNL